MVYTAGLPAEQIRASGDSLLELGRNTQDCESELLGAAIRIAHNVMEVDELLALIDQMNCPVVGYKPNNAIGTRFYFNQEYTQAMEWFKRAEQAANSDREAMACAIAIGACHSGIGNNVEAFREFNKAYNLAEHPAPMVLLNNLAASQTYFGLYEDAMELLDEALRTESLSTYELQLIRFNRLNVFVNTGKLDEAKVEYNRLREIFPKRLDATSFVIILQFVLELDTPAYWLDLKDQLEEALTYLDHDFVFAEEHPGRLLFQAYDDEWNELGVQDVGDSRWRTVKALAAAHNAMRLEMAKKLFAERNALAESTLGNKQIGLTSSSRTFPWWLALLGLAGVGVGWGLTRRKASNGVDFQDHDDDISQLSLVNRVTALLEEGLHDEDFSEVLNDLRGGVLETVQEQLNNLIQPEHELSKVERQALAFFILGYSPKQVAMLLDRSVGYIYNSRSILRKKLDLEKSVDFDRWYAQSQSFNPTKRNPRT